MVADPSEMSEGLYMTVEQYLALDEATDAKYEFLDGYVFMLRPPSSDYDDRAIDMAGGSIANAAICARMALLLGKASISVSGPDSGLRRAVGNHAHQSIRRDRGPLTHYREARSRRKIQNLPVLAIRARVPTDRQRIQGN
jgi:hypothetical protein